MKFKAKDRRINAMVWDSVANAPLITFRNGYAETTDKRVAEKLKALGYKEIIEKKAESPKAEAKQK